MKRIAYTLLTLCAALLLCAGTALADETWGDYTYTVKDGAVTITGYTGEAEYLAVPGMIDGMAVTGIGNRAFAGCESLTTVELPDSVELIGYCAFKGCWNLSSINYPMNWNSTYSNGLAGEVFADCRSLTSIVVPEGVTAIPASAFSGSELESIELPSTLQTIGGSAFRDCTNLKAVDMPSSLTTIGNYAFAGCESLTTVELPDSVELIGYCAFKGCWNLSSINYPLNWNSTYSNGLAGEVFADCRSLTSIVVPEGVTAIPASAFSGSELESIELPSTLTAVGRNAFYDCPDDLVLSVMSGTWAEQYVLENGIAHTYHTASSAVKPMTGAEQEDASRRMLLLDTGGAIYYHVRDGRVFIDAEKVAALKNALYNPDMNSLYSRGGVLFGALGEEDVYVTDGGAEYIDLEKAARMLGLVFSWDAEERAHVKVNQTPQELDSAVSQAVRIEAFHKFEWLVNNYFAVAEIGYEALELLSNPFELPGAIVERATGAYEQDQYNQAFFNAVVNTESYEETVKEYKETASAVVAPLKVLNYLETAATDKDGALATFCKILMLTESETADVLGEWGGMFYDAVYSGESTATIMTVADLYEAGAAVKLDELGMEALRLLNYCSACASADAMSIRGMNVVFANSDNTHMKNACERINGVYEDQVKGGLVAGGQDAAVKLMEEGVNKGAEWLTRKLTGGTYSLEAQVYGFTFKVVDKTLLDFTDTIETMTLHFRLCMMQQEEYDYLISIRTSMTDEELEDLQAVAVLYMRTVLALYDSGYYDDEADKAANVQKAQDQLRHLLTFRSEEYTNDYDNSAFIRKLTSR